MLFTLPLRIAHIAHISQRFILYISCAHNIKLAYMHRYFLRHLLLIYVVYIRDASFMYNINPKEIISSWAHIWRRQRNPSSWCEEYKIVWVDAWLWGKNIYKYSYIGARSHYPYTYIRTEGSHQLPQNISVNKLLCKWERFLSISKRTKDGLRYIRLMRLNRLAILNVCLRVLWWMLVRVETCDVTPPHTFYTNNLNKYIVRYMYETLSSANITNSHICVCSFSVQRCFTYIYCCIN